MFQSVGWRAAIVVAEVMLVLAVVGVLYYFPRAFLLATPIAGDNPRPTQTRQPTRPVAASLPTTRPTIFPTPRLAATAVIFASPSPTSAPTYTPAPGLDQPIGPFNLVAHRVETGESLISIAARFNTTRDVLIRVNGSAQRPIQSGQILVVPLGLVDSSQLPKMVAFQTVQDTPLDVIVNQLSGDMNTVRQLNALGDSNIVPAGRWLFIPQP